VGPSTNEENTAPNDSLGFSPLGKIPGKAGKGACKPECPRHASLAGPRAIHFSPCPVPPAGTALRFRRWDREAGRSAEGLENSQWGTSVLAFAGSHFVVSPESKPQNGLGWKGPSKII